MQEFAWSRGGAEWGFPIRWTEVQEGCPGLDRTFLLPARNHHKGPWGSGFSGSSLGLRLTETWPWPRAIMFASSVTYDAADTGVLRGCFLAKIWLKRSMVVVVVVFF